MKFLSILFGRCKGGFVEIRPFDSDYNLDFENRSWLPVANKKKIAKTMWALRYGHLFYGVATRTYKGKKKEKGSKEYLREIPALFADLDRSDYRSWEEIKEILTDFPFKPSCIVFSGHGLHVYYFLDPPVEVEENTARIEKILKIIQDKMLKADSTSDCSRVLRVPYSHNIKKPEKPQLTKIRKLKPITYRLEDFEDQYWKLFERDNKRKSNYSQGDRTVHEKDHGKISLSKLDVPARTKRLIRQGKSSDSFKSRSEADMSVICSLLSNGYGEETVKNIFQESPNGIGEKYHEKGDSGKQYLEHSIRSAKEFLSTEAKDKEAQSEQA